MLRILPGDAGLLQRAAARAALLGLHRLVDVFVHFAAHPEPSSLPASLQQTVTFTYYC
ncbi:hypothetical protein pipiens_020362, partial [Culex pipiens pipiens]